MSNLPLVDVFETRYESWETREQTWDEAIQSNNLHQRVKVRLEASIDNHFDAAKHMLLKMVDNSLESYIKNYLNNSSNYKSMRAKMPSITPKALSNYQRRFQSSRFEQVSLDINDFGEKLCDGQYLFHGGQLSIGVGESFITTRPFSTSFCPQISLRNAEWGGKAYDAGEINLFVLRATNPKTKVFCFRLKGTDKGHEAEILFAAGAKLTLRKKTLVKQNGNVYKFCGQELTKKVPFYILEVDIS